MVIILVQYISWWSDNPTFNIPRCVTLLGKLATIRLWYKKNKVVQQSHASPWNLEAIDLWKVARHPPSSHVVACEDYSFKNTIVFFLFKWGIQTIIKLKLKQASKEYQKEFHHKKYKKGKQKCFLLSYHNFTNFAMI